MTSGLKIKGFSNDLITNKIQRFGVYEPDLYGFLKAVLAKIDKPVCLDAGANIGNHTLTLCQNSESVYAFEPIPFVYDVLVENVELNNFKNLTAFNLALGDTESAEKIYIRKDTNVGTAMINPENTQGFGSGIDIKIVRGDDVLSQGLNRLDLVKMDVEGFETAAIKGLSETLTRNRPLFIMEWNDDKTRIGFSESNFFATVFKDYKPFRLTDRNDAYREKLNQNILLKPIKGILRKLRKSLKEPGFTLLENPNLKKNHGSLVLVPMEKLPLVKQFIYS